MKKIILAFLFFLSLGLIGCRAPEVAARRQVVRMQGKIDALLAQFPQLAELKTKRVIDSLVVDGASGGAQFARGMDSTAFDSLLTQYVNLKLALEAAKRAHHEAQGANLGPAPAPPAAAPTSPAMAAELARLKQALRLGAYRDTVYYFDDSVLMAEIEVKGGRMAFTYFKKPQVVQYTREEKTLNLAPAPKTTRDKALEAVAYLGGVLFVLFIVWVLFKRPQVL